MEAEACFKANIGLTGLIVNSKAEAKDSTLKAKTKDFKIVLEDPRGRGLVLEDSNTVDIYLN